MGTKKQGWWIRNYMMKAFSPYNSTVMIENLEIRFIVFMALLKTKFTILVYSHEIKSINKLY